TPGAIVRAACGRSPRPRECTICNDRSGLRAVTAVARSKQKSEKGRGSQTPAGAPPNAAGAGRRQSGAHREWWSRWAILGVVSVVAVIVLAGGVGFLSSSWRGRGTLARTAAEPKRGSLAGGPDRPPSPPR